MVQPLRKYHGLYALNFASNSCVPIAPFSDAALRHPSRRKISFSATLSVHGLHFTVCAPSKNNPHHSLFWQIPEARVRRKKIRPQRVSLSRGTSKMPRDKKGKLHQKSEDNYFSPEKSKLNTLDHKGILGTILEGQFFVLLPLNLSPESCANPQACFTRDILPGTKHYSRDNFRRRG